MTVPSLAPPLTLRLLLPPFLVTSLEKSRWWKKWLEDAPLLPPLTPATHTVVTHTHRVTHATIFSRAQILLHKALGGRAKMTHPPTSLPTSLSKIPRGYSL